MQSLWLGALLLFSQFLSPVVAGGERAYAEKMLYWFDYWIETQIKTMDPSYAYTVAPDCVGAGPRCTFEELMLHIWAENKNPGTHDNVKPSSLTLTKGASEKINSLSLNINQFFGYLTTARFDTGAGLDGFTDSSKLMSNAGDYYDVLARMGDPIKKFSDTVESVLKTNPSVVKPNYPKIWQRAKDTTAALTALRRSDSDTYRIKNFKSWLPTYDGWPADYEPKIVKAELKTELRRKIEVIDFQETINQNKDKVPDIEDRLKVVNARYLATDQGGPHSKAIYAAEASMAGCECTKNFVPTDLKKKREV